MFRLNRGATLPPTDAVEAVGNERLGDMGMDTGQSPEAVGVEDREPQPVLSIRANVRRPAQAQGESLQALWSFMERRGVTPTPGRYVRYHTLGQTRAIWRSASRSPRPSPRRVGRGGRASGRRRDHHLAPRVARWPGRPRGAWSPGCKRTDARRTVLRGRSTGGSTQRGARPRSLARADRVAHAAGPTDQVILLTSGAKPMPNDNVARSTPKPDRSPEHRRALRRAAQSHRSLADAAKRQRT